MPATKEKGRPAEGSPIPKVVLADATEPKASLRNLQVSRLTRCAVSAAMAVTIAPLIFGEMQS
jgi:hypothetical protein